MSIFRNVDLVGKNLRKVQAIRSKIQTRVCKDCTLGYLGLHDLARVSLELRVEEDSLQNLSICTGEELGGEELLARTRSKYSKAFNAYVMGMVKFQVLRDQEKVRLSSS